MKTSRGPYATLAVAAAVGAGLWLLNTSQDPAAAPVAAPAAVTQPAAAPPAPPAPPPPAQLPAPADYSTQIPTKGAPIALDISVAGATAKAYACDGYDIETWLSGAVTGDVLNLTNKDRSSRLEGRIQGRAVVGTLSIGDRSWDFTAPVVTDAR
ncbi:MAG: hypothetical protein ABWY45_16100 [Mycobacterium sp.]